MPAASTKIEPKGTIPEGNDPIKQALQVVDKKMRNLEKRKQKLDAYISQRTEGKPLAKEQQEAVGRYGEVIQTLEFARELQKQFVTISAEFDKFMKKQAKRDCKERQSFEMRRHRELLTIQSLLDKLQSEEVRNDFMTGKDGAVVLTEENLNQLDQLEKALKTSKDPEVNFECQLQTTSEHIVYILDGREKDVFGTSYKELKELIDLINNCGYFEKVVEIKEDEEEFNKEIEETNEVEEPTEIQPAFPHHEETTLIADQMHAEADAFFASQAQQSYQEQQSQQLQQQQQEQQQQSLEEKASQQKQRPFQEIVSSVQGNFNFLQDSEIDLESPHNDPAVVAAHPMAPGLQDERTSYSTKAFSDQLESSQTHEQSTGFNSTHEQSSGFSSQSSQQSFPNQGFSQNSLPSDSLFKPEQQTQSALRQSNSEQTQFDISSGMGINSNQESDDSANQNEKKTFQMNVHAPVFNYSPPAGNTSSDEGQDQDSGNQHNSEDGDSEQQSGQGGNRGGFRGRPGGRGTNNGFRGRGSRGMQNGFGRGGNYNNRGNRGFGNRGGYQNYNRNDRGGDNNYQSYNSNGYSGEGGRGFKSRGGPRGSSRGGGERGTYSRPQQ